MYLFFHKLTADGFNGKSFLYKHIHKVFNTL